MKKILYSVSVLFCLFATSCGKDKDNAPEQKTILLSKVNNNNGNSETWEYDNQHRLIKRSINIASNPMESTSTGFIYNAQGVLTAYTLEYSNPATSGGRSVITYVDPNGRSMDIENIRASDSKIVSKGHYEFGTTFSSYVQLNSAGEPVYDEEYTFSANKNIEKIVAYSYAGGVRSSIFSTTTFLDFDDKKSALSFLPLLYPTRMLSSKNLPGTRKVTNSAGSTTTVTYTYEYNQEGYPTKRTSNAGEVITYEYTYK